MKNVEERERKKRCGGGREKTGEDLFIREER